MTTVIAVSCLPRCRKGQHTCELHRLTVVSHATMKDTLALAAFTSY
jgi:hypothetical protein